jgi:hypothetical protein
MRIPTIRIRKKGTKKFKIVNEYEWARDLGLGRYAGWERAGGETHVDTPTRELQDAIKLHDSTAYERPQPTFINDAPAPDKESAAPAAKDPEPLSKGKGKTTDKDESEDDIASLTFGDAIREIKK